MKKESKDIIISNNKGQFELSSLKKLKLFHEKLSDGWDKDEYLEYRKAWKEYPEKKITKEYPLQIDIELSSICNLKCPMCYTRTKEYIKNIKTGHIDFELYKKIINEIAGKVFVLRLSWRGESTLYPHFFDAVKYAKTKGIKEISLLTNGSTLTLNFFKEMVKSGVDWLSISIDGTGEIYNKIRSPLMFDETLQKIKDISNYKKINGIIKPVIKIQTLWPAIKENPNEYFNIFDPIVDLISYNPLIDYLGRDKDIIYEDNFICPQIYQRIYIASNGDVMVCNNDEYGKEVVGNVQKQTIGEIWNGKKIKKIRQQHNKKDGFKKMEMCRKCFVPRKTEANEESFINGRKVIIENYINRKQKIGK